MKKREEKEEEGIMDSLDPKKEIFWTLCFHLDGQKIGKKNIYFAVRCSFCLMMLLTSDCGDF